MQKGQTEASHYQSCDPKKHMYFESKWGHRDEADGVREMTVSSTVREA